MKILLTENAFLPCLEKTLTELGGNYQAHTHKHIAKQLELDARERRHWQSFRRARKFAVPSCRCCFNIEWSTVAPGGRTRLWGGTAMRRSNNARGTGIFQTHALQNEQASQGLHCVN